MARKTNGSVTTTRSKKAELQVQPAAAQAAQEVSEVSKDVRKNGKSANLNNLVSINLEEEIRRRAYELYLQRRATAGEVYGDENQDWLMAEQEIRSRFGGHEQHTA